MGKSKHYSEVQVWQLAHAFVLKIYVFTEEFPRSEEFGLISQLRRAAVSVPANFVEGFKRHSLAEKHRFYNIAQASLDEARYYLNLASDLRYGNSEMLIQECDALSRKLAAYIRGMPPAKKSNK